jgi:hypothetical protein
MTAVVIMSRFSAFPGAVPPAEQAATAADLSRLPIHTIKQGFEHRLNAAMACLGSNR